MTRISKILMTLCSTRSKTKIQSKMIWIFCFERVEHKVNRIFEILVIFSHFGGVDKLDQGGKVFFIFRGLVPDVTEQCAVKQGFGFDPKVVAAFALAFGI